MSGIQYLVMVHGDPAQAAVFLANLNKFIDSEFQKFPGIAVLTDRAPLPDQPGAKHE